MTVSPSIHPLSAAYPWSSRGGSIMSRGPQTSLSLATSKSGGSQGIPRPVQRYDLSTWIWACPRASSQLDVPGTSLERHPEGILTRCLNDLNWLLSTQRSSGSSPSSSRMTELLTLSLREMPATLLRKPHFSHLYPQSHPFGHHPSFMNIGEGRNKD